jgi:SNF2 family DNA or RNA helicase
MHSHKLNPIVTLIHKILDSGRDKILVFSQTPGFLKLVEDTLFNTIFQYYKNWDRGLFVKTYKGTTSHKKRIKFV